MLASKGLRILLRPLRALPSRPMIALPMARFSTAAIERPSKDISHLPKLKDPILVEAEKQLAVGNTAEAYGLHPDAGLIGHSGLWEKFGFATTAGWFAVAAISKEWYVLDPESVLAATFATALFVGYVSARESVFQGLVEGQKEQHEQVNQAVDAKLDHLDAQKADLKYLLKFPEAYLPLHEEAAALQLATAKAYERKFAYELKNNVERQLSAIEAQENKFYEELRNSAATGAIEHVKKTFASGAEADKVRAASVDAAIAALSKKGKPQNVLAPIVAKYVQDFDKSVAGKTAEFHAKLKKQLEAIDFTPANFPTQKQLDEGLERIKFT